VPRAAPALLLAAVLVAGCGGTSADPEADPTSAGSPAPVSSKPTEPPRSAPSTPQREGLADLAEQEASRVPTSAAPPVGPARRVLGADISWPQCPRGMGIPERPTQGMPMPIAGARYVVIGLTNGPGYTANPCLAEQVAWVRDRKLMAAAYSVASFPDARTLARHRHDGPYDGSSRLGALRNAGHQQALFNLASLQASGLETPVVWIDVEPVTVWEWTDDPVANAAVVRGIARAYTDAGYRIGVYSTPNLWSRVVGGLRLGVPEWRAAGQTSREEALRRCGSDWSIQGGAPVLAQWVERSRDQNVTCPGVHVERWFHQYS
jgi:hypothetical protein